MRPLALWSFVVFVGGRIFFCVFEVGGGLTERKQKRFCSFEPWNLLLYMYVMQSMKRAVSFMVWYVVVYLFIV